jgi:hypothetical protein
MDGKRYATVEEVRELVRLWELVQPDADVEAEGIDLREVQAELELPVGH